MNKRLWNLTLLAFAFGISAPAYAMDIATAKSNNEDESSSISDFSSTSEDSNNTNSQKGQISGDVFDNESASDGKYRRKYHSYKSLNKISTGKLEDTTSKLALEKRNTEAVTQHATQLAEDLEKANATHAAELTATKQKAEVATNQAKEEAAATHAAALKSKEDEYTAKTEEMKKQFAQVEAANEVAKQEAEKAAATHAAELATAKQEAEEAEVAHAAELKKVTATHDAAITTAVSTATTTTTTTTAATTPVATTTTTTTTTARDNSDSNVGDNDGSGSDGNDDRAANAFHFVAPIKFSLMQAFGKLVTGKKDAPATTPEDLKAAIADGTLQLDLLTQEDLVGLKALFGSNEEFQALFDEDGPLQTLENGATSVKTSYSDDSNITIAQWLGVLISQKADRAAARQSGENKTQFICDSIAQSKWVIESSDALNNNLNLGYISDVDGNFSEKNKGTLALKKN